MAKTKMNFRLSGDALMALARLSGLWGCDRTAVIERALAEADPVTVPPEEVAKVVKKAATPPSAPPLPNPNTVLSREEREAKIDAFQRKMAKGKK